MRMCMWVCVCVRAYVFECVCVFCVHDYCNTHMQAHTHTRSAHTLTCGLYSNYYSNYVTVARLKNRQYFTCSFRDKNINNSHA